MTKPGSRSYIWTLLLLLQATLGAHAQSTVRHQDRQLGFSLDLPLRWTVERSDVPGIVRFHGERCAPGVMPSRGCREYVVVIRGTAQERESSEAAYRRRMGPWKMLSEGRIVVDGETVPWGVMETGTGRGDPVMRLWTVVVVRGGHWFEFTGWSRAASFAEAEPIFQRMAQSLAFP